jgi:membrane associated rhomboid family serine protease
MSASPNLTFIIILLNVLISMTALYAFPQMISTGFLQPYRTVRKHTWYELITSGFLHANFGHLAFNMITLFFFGTVMESTLGPYHFAALYFSGLIISALPSLIKYKDSPEYATLGASGAVESVLFAFIFLFPMEKIYIFFIPIGIPAFVFGGIFIAYSLYESKKEGGKINHEAHIAGAVWGILYLILFVPNTIDHILTIMGLI